jgi:organic radical activating enzyme
MKTLNRDTLTYPIVETFHSVQGEGAWTGANAYFIRLGGCDVYCPWCDQKESWLAERHPQQSVRDLVQQATHVNPAIVIITGGEPLLHDLAPLTRQLKETGLRVHLETSGAHPFSGIFDWVTFSPKRYKTPDLSIYSQVRELKVVVADEDDFRWAVEQAAKVPATTVKYLQPEWNTPESQQLIFDYVLRHPEWRIGLQSHKFLGVR